MAEFKAAPSICRRPGRSDARLGGDRYPFREADQCTRLRLWYIGVNSTRGALEYVRVRQAIASAIDAPTLLTQLLAGRGRVAAGVIPPTLDGADTTRKAFPYDAGVARALLHEAGINDGLDLELWCSQSAPFPRVAQSIQAYLAAAGIRVKIVQRDAGSMRAAARAGRLISCSRNGRGLAIRN